MCGEVRVHAGFSIGRVDGKTEWYLMKPSVGSKGEEGCATGIARLDNRLD